MNAPQLKRLQIGLSMVELLIAMALGLLLMTGVIQVFLTSRQTYAANEAMGRLQENGRFALDFIARNARNAGYIDPINLNNLPAPIALSGCPTSYCTADNISSTSDRIALAMQPVPQDGKRYSCTGDEVAPPAVSNSSAIIYNSFYVKNGSLWCNWGEIGAASAKTEKEIVPGIDSLRVLYGVASSSNSSSTSRYIPATDITDWTLVRSVRIAVLANSVETITPRPDATTNYYLLDAAPISQGNDGLARQIFTTTIQLKNI